MRWIALTTLALALPLLAGTPPAGVHPIVDAGAAELFGGCVDGRWVTAEHLYQRIAGGERYRVYSPDRCLGTAVGGKGVYNEDEPGCPSVDIDLPAAAAALVKRATLVAIRGDWNALPRVAKPQSTRQTAYVAAARDLLRAKGLRNPRVRLTRVLRVDLEGDGRDEVLIAATTPRPGYGAPDAKAGDYSLVFARRLVKGRVVTVTLCGNVFPRDAAFAAPQTFTLESVLDVNGDGILEVVTGWSYYEGAGKAIHTLAGAAARQVLTSGWGA